MSVQIRLLIRGTIHGIIQRFINILHERLHLTLEIEFDEYSSTRLDFVFEYSRVQTRVIAAALTISIGIVQFSTYSNFRLRFRVFFSNNFVSNFLFAGISHRRTKQQG